MARSEEAEGMPTLGRGFRDLVTFFGGDVVSDDDEGDRRADHDIDVHLTSYGMTVGWRNREEGFEVGAMTDDAQYILTRVMPDLLEAFLKNNAKYARAQDIDLGVKGIVPDINRKASVIIDRLWNDAPVLGESTEEVIDDLIGHLLLMRAKMRGES